MNNDLSSCYISTITLVVATNICFLFEVMAGKETKGKSRANENVQSLTDFEIKRIEEMQQFPTTLEEFGYKFNEAGQLRDIKTDGGFEFVVKKDDHHYNQLHYEAIGEVITEHVYKLLEEEAGLKRVSLPIDAADDDPKSFIFMSNYPMKNPEKLIILIHGSGVVRAGQWARKLIINDNLGTGTQLQYIKRAIGGGYEVMVLNPNHNYVIENNVKKLIKGNSSPEDHVLYVWDTLIKEIDPKHIAVVAHSYGGVVTIHLGTSREKSLKKIFAVAFTDSVHHFFDVPKQVMKFFQENSINWVSSSKPLDTEVPKRSNKDVPLVSAGHPQHEMTSSSCLESVFKFIDKKFEKHRHKEKEDL